MIADGIGVTIVDGIDAMIATGTTAIGMIVADMTAIGRLLTIEKCGKVITMDLIAGARMRAIETGSIRTTPAISGTAITPIVKASAEVMSRAIAKTHPIAGGNRQRETR